MSNFNAVFAVVKKHSATQGKQKTDIFNICRDVEMRPEKVDFYLQCLTEIGVVQYSRDDRSVSLTAKGHTKERIFPI